jgi:hypothetical protein
MPSSEAPSLSRIVVAEPRRVVPEAERRWTRRGVGTMGATVLLLEWNGSGGGFGTMPLTSVAAGSAVADGVAVDFPGDPALAVVVVYRGIDSSSLGQWADESLVADWLVGSRDAAGFCGADAVFCRVLFCGRAVVHHEAAVVQFDDIWSPL